jgi:hypothetical protein
VLVGDGASPICQPPEGACPPTKLVQLMESPVWRMSSEARRELASDLQSRQAQIREELLLAIPESLRDPLSGTDADFAYAQGEAISAALDYALKTLAGAPGRSAVPPPVLEQARRSARHSVGLESVVSLYIAARELLGQIVAAEAERYDSEGERAAQAVLGALLQQLVPLITRAHQKEAERLRRSREQRSAARVRRLLAGELVDVAPLDYDFGGWHTALIVTGTGVQAARSVLERLGHKALFVTQDEETVWGWLGNPKPVAATELESFVQDTAVPGTSFVIGEPARDLRGWRLTHRLAQEARRVAIIAPKPVTTYASVGVLAPWALDRPRGLAFIEVHLGKFTNERDGGASARETLRAIFTAGHQIEAAASALKVDRKTLRTRLSRIERKLGFPLRTRQAELEIALRLEALYGLSQRNPGA